MYEDYNMDADRLNALVYPDLILYSNEIHDLYGVTTKKLWNVYRREGKPWELPVEVISPEDYELLKVKQRERWMYVEIYQLLGLVVEHKPLIENKNFDKLLRHNYCAVADHAQERRWYALTEEDIAMLNITKRTVAKMLEHPESAPIQGRVAYPTYNTYEVMQETGLNMPEIEDIARKLKFMGIFTTDVTQINMAGRSNYEP
jgi:hypothetical protein